MKIFEKEKNGKFDDAPNKNWKEKKKKLGKEVMWMKRRKRRLAEKEKRVSLTRIWELNI
jgi:hypothetical protein